eukprot:scaffold4472_cov89-Skeletonema_marinoi.AAC.2
MSKEESASYGAIPRGDAEDAEFDERNLSYLQESGDNSIKGNEKWYSSEDASATTKSPSGAKCAANSKCKALGLRQSRDARTNFVYVNTNDYYDMRPVNQTDKNATCATSGRFK